MFHGEEFLTLERRHQIEDLASKVVALESEWHRARAELRATETQHQALTADAKSQLAQVEVEHREMQRDICQLKKKLEEVKHIQAGRAEDDQNLLAEKVQQLMSVRHHHEAQIEAARSEVSVLRERLEVLNDQRVRTRQELKASTDTTLSLKASLAEAKQKLEVSEEQRLSLRERYLVIGEQFEQALGISEEKGQALTAELQKELKRQQGRTQKYQQRVKEAEAELAQIEANIVLQQGPLRNREQELLRLRSIIDNERQLADSREEWYLKCQQQLHNATLTSKPSREMLSFSVHERLLEDQARLFRDRLQHLEGRLQQRQQAFKDAILQKELETNLQSIVSVAETKQPAQGSSSASTAAFENSRLQEISSTENEISEVQLAKSRVIQREANAEKQSSELAASLAEAKSNIMRLQSIVDEERKVSTTLRSEADDAAASILEAELHRGLQDVLQLAFNTAASAERNMFQEQILAEEQYTAKSISEQQVAGQTDLAALLAKQEHLETELKVRKEQVWQRTEHRARRLSELREESNRYESLLEAAMSRAKHSELEAQVVSKTMQDFTSRFDTQPNALPSPEVIAQAVSKASADDVQDDLQHILNDIKQTQDQFQAEVARRREVWENRIADETRSQYAFAAVTEAQLQAEAQEARVEITIAERAELASLQMIDQQMTSMKDQLNRGKTDLTEARRRCEQREAECRAMFAEEMEGKKALVQVEQRAEEAEKARRSELEELDQRHSALRSKHLLELETLRQHQTLELSQTQSMLNQSLSTISLVVDEEN